MYQFLLHHHTALHGSHRFRAKRKENCNGIVVNRLFCGLTEGTVTENIYSGP